MRTVPALPAALVLAACAPDDSVTSDDMVGGTET